MGALILGALSSPAFATCLTRDDLAGGVRATYQDGQVEEYRLVGPNLVEMLIDFGDGLVTEHLLGHGIYLIDIFDRENGVEVPGSRYVTAYDVPLTAMPLPAPNEEWVASVTMGSESGSFAEVQTHKWGAATDLTLGECTYAVVPGTIRYESEDDMFIEDLNYLPDVGIALLIAYTDKVDGRIDYAPLASLARVGGE